MAKPTNNHNRERTTTVAVREVSVREEVGRALNAAVSALPEKQKNEVIDRVSQIVDRYSSPYPDADYLAEIEALAPGCTKDIIAASIKHLDHCHISEMKELEVKSAELQLIDRVSSSDFKSVAQGRWLGFFAYIALLVFSATMYVFGAEKLAYAAFGASVLGIISQLIAGARRRSAVEFSAGNDGENESPQTPTRKK